MHQDWAFYKHDDDRFVDVLVHLDDTCHGERRDPVPRWLA
jgi:hypothetical protein